MRIELSNGNSAQLRAPGTITEAASRRLLEIGVRARYAESEKVRAQAMVESDYEMIAVFVESWSFDLPVPSEGLQHLLSLNRRDVQLLRQACTPLCKEEFADEFAPTLDQSSPFLAAGTSPVGVEGSEDRHESAAAAGMAAVPADQADRVDA